MIALPSPSPVTCRVSSQVVSDIDNVVGPSNFACWACKEREFQLRNLTKGGSFGFSTRRIRLLLPALTSGIRS